ncbi:hypothetical protein [Rhizobium bangladeshense]|uniref:hypothetical protein n=1 Tax=Rhizobium bangladeshense TaxID=1138189 RepID=UPI0012E7DFA3|nr:hypothetical protein [Rhizobium bangladeshense]
MGTDEASWNRQVAAHMKRDESTETVLDVLHAFATLSVAGVRGSARHLRLMIGIFGDLWAAELEGLPFDERLDLALATFCAMGLAIPEEKANRLAELARRELARRGMFIPEGAGHG